MRRLPAVRTTRIDVVVRPDRDVDLLLQISIVVAKEKTECAVRIREPSFESPGDARGGFVRRARSATADRKRKPTRRTPSGRVSRRLWRVTPSGSSLTALRWNLEGSSDRSGHRPSRKRLPATAAVLRLVAAFCAQPPRRVVLVADVGDVHPGVRHLVDRAVAVAHPLIGIGIVRVRCVLSCHAVTWMIVPFGNTGAASSA